MQLCPTCTTPPTPLDEGGRCVTCDARAEGRLALARSGFAQIREMMTLLEEAGLAPEMEKVPPARPEERHHPAWNLYAPEDEVARAREVLQRDWAALLEDLDAARAAARGQDAVDVDAGGEVECPACGHRFTLSGGAEAECPECGLGLGAPGLAAPAPGEGEER